MKNRSPDDGSPANPPPPREPGHETPEWSDEERLSFCAALFDRGIQYLDLKAFCRAELDATYPSTWTHEARARALKDLKPDGPLRQRYEAWNESDISERIEERSHHRPAPSIPPERGYENPAWEDCGGGE
jgi:hypothetical protein